MFVSSDILSLCGGFQLLIPLKLSFSGDRGLQHLRERCNFGGVVKRVCFARRNIRSLRVEANIGEYLEVESDVSDSGGNPIYLVTKQDDFCNIGTPTYLYDPS